jgi:hypothetical protein
MLFRFGSASFAVAWLAAILCYLKFLADDATFAAKINSCGLAVFQI